VFFIRLLKLLRNVPVKSVDGQVFLRSKEHVAKALTLRVCEVNVQEKDLEVAFSPTSPKLFPVFLLFDLIGNDLHLCQIHN
jgi:hypothetical protein